MGFSADVNERVRAILSERRRAVEDEYERRLLQVYAIEPALNELNREQGTTCAELSRAVIESDSSKQLELLTQAVKLFEEQRCTLLGRHGYPSDYLTIPYICKSCRDTGYDSNNRMCECMQRELIKEAHRELNSLTGMRLCSFDSFRLDYYPDEPDRDYKLVPRKKMAEILDSLKSYAENFSLSSPSLLLIGKTGLGKTHLSLAAADKIISRGFGVVYGSYQSFLMRIEDERFGRSDGDTLTLLNEAELLILDDLGAELMSAFSAPVTYNLISTRIQNGRPTIINTNLSTAELRERYPDRITSRILGGYLPFLFVGQDIRQKLAMGKNA